MKAPKIGGWKDAKGQGGGGGGVLTSVCVGGGHLPSERLMWVLEGGGGSDVVHLDTGWGRWVYALGNGCP